MNSGHLARHLHGCVESHRLLIAALDGLTDDVVLAPSLLPDWSIGHVLSHVARNADSFSGMLEGAARGEVVAQYPSMERRGADIEAGAALPLTPIIDDLTRSCHRLEEHFRQATAEMWASVGSAATGPVVLSELPSRRRREVEVHHADLGLGYAPERWPADFVRFELSRLTMVWASRRPMGLTMLPPEALAVAPCQRLAWMLGRTTIEGLPAAGLS